MRKILHHALLAPSPAQLNITFTLKIPLKPGLCPTSAFPGGPQLLDKSEPLETPPGLELRQISDILELPALPTKMLASSNDILFTINVTRLVEFK